MNVHISKLRDFADRNYDPEFSDEAAYGDVLDPYPLMHKIAERGSVQAGDWRLLQGMAPDSTTAHLPTFIVFGYDEIREVYSNTDNFSMEHFRSGLSQAFGSQSLSVLDAPDHPRYRRIFQKAFLPHVVGTWSQEYIEPVINELMDKFMEKGRCDLMTEFVRPYPFEIIYRQLKLPPDEAKIFHRLSVALTLFFVDMEHAREAHDKLGTYFRTVIDERRRNPGTDLISVLASVELDGENLSDEVLLSFLRQLLNAAGDTTYRTTGNMLVGLLAERPDQFEMLKADRMLIPKAIEETLRLEAPTNMDARTVRRDTILGGMRLPKGAVVHMAKGVADRDHKVYPDADKFDMMRARPRGHVAFGIGAHVCLGQHLARLEITRAMNILLDRLPKLRLDINYPKPEIRGNMMRRPKHIYVRFD